jgi:DNA-binding transcriptional LysR family regulator
VLAHLGLINVPLGYSHPALFSAEIKLHEMNEREIAEALVERRLDVALMTKHTLWAGAVAVPIYRERIVAALPSEHPLAASDPLDWTALGDETFLVQGWDESQSAREFYTSFMGSGVRFSTHAARKQVVLARRRWLRRHARDAAKRKRPSPAWLSGALRMRMLGSRLISYGVPRARTQWSAVSSLS